MNTINLNNHLIPDYNFNEDQIKQSIEVIKQFLESESSKKPSKQDLRILRYAMMLFEKNEKQLGSLFTKEIYEDFKKNIERKKSSGQETKITIAIKKIIFKEPYSDVSSDDEWNIIGQDKDKKCLTIPRTNSRKDNFQERGPKKTSVDIDRRTLCELTQSLGDFEILPNADSFPDDDTTEMENIYKAKEILVISQFGQALFKDYLPDLIICLKRSIYDLFEDKYLLAQVKHLLETHANGDKSAQDQECVVPSSSLSATSPLSANKASVNLFTIGHADLLNLTLIIQTKSCVQGLRDIIQNIVDHPKYRLQFPALIFAAIPAHLRKHLIEGMHPEAYQLIDFFIRSYLPEILEASIRKIHELLQDSHQAEKLEKHLSAFLGKQRGDIDVDIVELVAYLILNHILEPAEAGFNVFVKKMNEEQLNTELKKHLDVILKDLIYNTPGPFKPEQKKLLLNIIISLHNFFKALNQAKSTYDTLKINSDNPEKTYAEMVFQNLSGTLPDTQGGTEIDFLDKNLRLLLEEILWKFLYPKIPKQNRSASLTVKMVVTLLSAYVQQIACKICSPQFLNVLLDKLLSGPMVVENPFERDMPPDHMFKGNDEQFSTQVNIHLKGVLQQVLNYCSNSVIIKAMGEKALKFIPELGSLVELKLNKIGNSPSPVLPLLIGIQFLYKVEAKNAPALEKNLSPKEVRKQTKCFSQSLFLTALDHKRSPAMTAYLRASPASYQSSNTVEEKILGKKSKELEKLFLEVIPAPFRLLGASDAVIGCIQSFYKIFKEELTLKLLLMYVLKGVEATLDASGQ